MTIDTPEAAEALTFMKTMIDQKVTQPDPGATDRTPLLDVFIQGKIGMIQGLPPIVGQINEKNPDLKWEIAPSPTKDGSPVHAGCRRLLRRLQQGRGQAGRDQEVPRLLLRAGQLRQVQRQRGLHPGHQVGRRGGRLEAGAEDVPRVAAGREVLPGHQPGLGPDLRRVQVAGRSDPDQAGGRRAQGDPGQGRRDGLTRPPPARRARRAGRVARPGGNRRVATPIADPQRGNTGAETARPAPDDPAGAAVARARADPHRRRGRVPGRLHDLHVVPGPVPVRQGPRLGRAWRTTSGCSASTTCRGC